MNTYIKDIKNVDGSTETLVITSNDNYKINASQKLKLSNNYSKPNFFKRSILGTDVGFKDSMFTYVFLTSLVMVILGIVIMFYNYRIY